MKKSLVEHYRDQAEAECLAAAVTVLTGLTALGIVATGIVWGVVAGIQAVVHG